MSYLRQAILRADQRLWILGQTLFMGCEQHLLLFKHIRAIALGPTIKITEVNPLMTKMPLYQSGKKMVRSLLLCAPLFPHFGVIGWPSMASHVTSSSSSPRPRVPFFPSCHSPPRSFNLDIHYWISTASKYISLIHFLYSLILFCSLRMLCHVPFQPPRTGWDSSPWPLSVHGPPLSTSPFMNSV